MELEELCKKIELPPEVQDAVLKYAEKEFSEELSQAVCDVARKESAEEAYRILEAWCEKKNAGLDMLSYMLLAALHAYDAYLEKGIEEKIFVATMKCFTRFVGEHKASYGYYGFDRGWWAYRQLSMVLFRVGELEYEFQEEKQRIDLHIPSDARIELSFCKESLADFRIFVKAYFPAYADFPIAMESWLLSPALDNFLKADSKIVKFKNCFEILAWDKEDRDFLQWVYGKEDIVYDALPESTSLQRNMKAYLLQGGKVGTAEGVLREFG